MKKATESEDSSSIDKRKDIMETNFSGQVISGRRLKHNILPSHHDIEEKKKSYMLNERKKWELDNSQRWDNY